MPGTERTWTRAISEGGDLGGHPAQSGLITPAGLRRLRVRHVRQHHAVSGAVMVQVFRGDRFSVRDRCRLIPPHIGQVALHGIAGRSATKPVPCWSALKGAHAGRRCGLGGHCQHLPGAGTDDALAWDVRLFLSHIHPIHPNCVARRSVRFGPATWKTGLRVQAGLAVDSHMGPAGRRRPRPSRGGEA